jgi:aspartate aminotransferase
MPIKRPPINSPSFFIGKGDGNDLISFGSGQPDLPPPNQIFKILPKFKDFKYGLIQGQLRLREELAKQYPRSNPNQFLITNGASEAITLVFRFLANKGKRVLLPRPYYYSYPHNAKYANLDVNYYDLVNGKIDLDNFKKNMVGCCAVMINSPSNPTGSIQEIPVLREIEKITQEQGMYIVSDEVYKDLIYERENYFFKGSHVITINSFSKTFAMCGLRVGYLYSTDQEVLDTCITYKTHLSMNTNILGQEMAYAALKAPKSYTQKQVAIWKKRRNLIYQGLVDLGLDLQKPEGAFYVFPKFENSSRVVNDLFYDYRMITYDGTWFGSPGRVRFSYALDVSKIKEGLRRLEAYMKKRGLR